MGILVVGMAAVDNRRGSRRLVAAGSRGSLMVVDSSGSVVVVLVRRQLAGGGRGRSAVVAGSAGHTRWGTSTVHSRAQSAPNNKGCNKHRSLLRP